MVPLIQQLDFSRTTTYQAGYEVTRPVRETEESGASVGAVELDTDELGIAADEANLVVSHEPGQVRLDFVRLDQTVALFDLEEGRFVCTTGKVRPTCEPLDADAFDLELGPWAAFVPEELLVLLGETQDWSGARVELSHAEIAGQPSDCARVRGAAPIVVGDIEVDEWDVCVTGDGVLARFEAGETKVELVDYRAGVPSALLTTPEELKDQPDDPVLAVAEEVDERLRALAALEGEDTDPRRRRFLHQVEAENLAIALEPVENFRKDGRVTVRTGRGVACLKLEKRPDQPGTAARGACEPVPTTTTSLPSALDVPESADTP